MDESENSAKSWSFWENLGSFELLLVWTTRKSSYLLNLVNYKPYFSMVELLDPGLYVVDISYLVFTTEKVLIFNCSALQRQALQSRWK